MRSSTPDFGMPYYSYDATGSGPLSLSGKAGLMLSLVLLVAAVWLADAAPAALPQWSGVCFRGDFSADISAPTARWINCGLLAAAACYAAGFTKHINFLPTGVLLFSSALLLMCAATPQTSAALCAGVPLLFASLLCLHILFAVSSSRQSTGAVFLIFTFLSWGSCILGSFVLLMPLFLLCILFCGHLRLRGFLAMLFGIAAPYWILIAFGVVNLSELAFPRYLNIASIGEVDLPMFRLLLTVGITALLYLCALLVNCVSPSSSGAAMRARWACIHLLGFSLLACMLLDFGHIAEYLPAFYLFVGYELAQWCARMRPAGKSYLALVLFILYTALYLAFRLIP